MAKRLMRFDPEVAADVAYSSAAEFVGLWLPGASPADKAELLAALGPHIQTAIFAGFEALSGEWDLPDFSDN